MFRIVPFVALAVFGLPLGILAALYFGALGVFWHWFMFREFE
jgi:hypothetical protein